MVKILRAVDDQLQKLSVDLEGRDKLVAIHANRFILFTIFQELSLDVSQPISEFGPIENLARLLTRRNLKALLPIVNDLFPDGYAGNVFKNTDKQTKILDVLEQRLPEELA